MAKVKFASTVKIDALGKWQPKILEAVIEKLPGSRAAPVPLPNGLAGLVVHWEGFHGHNVNQRQEIVRGVIDRLGADASKRISMIVTLTPDAALIHSKTSRRSARCLRPSLRRTSCVRYRATVSRAANMITEGTTT